jgi:hypothetical protein
MVIKAEVLLQEDFIYTAPSEDAKIDSFPDWASLNISWLFK